MSGGETCALSFEKYKITSFKLLSKYFYRLLPYELYIQNNDPLF